MLMYFRAISWVETFVQNNKANPFRNVKRTDLCTIKSCYVTSSRTMKNNDMTFTIYHRTKLFRINGK